MKKAAIQRWLVAAALAGVAAACGTPESGNTAPSSSVGDDATIGFVPPEPTRSCSYGAIQNRPQVQSVAAGSADADAGLWDSQAPAATPESAAIAAFGCELVSLTFPDPNDLNHIVVTVTQAGLTNQAAAAFPPEINVNYEVAEHDRVELEYAQSVVEAYADFIGAELSEIGIQSGSTILWNLQPTKRADVDLESLQQYLPPGVTVEIALLDGQASVAPETGRR